MIFGTFLIIILLSVIIFKGQSIEKTGSVSGFEEQVFAQNIEDNEIKVLTYNKQEEELGVYTYFDEEDYGPEMQPETYTYIEDEVYSDI